MIEVLRFVERYRDREAYHADLHRVLAAMVRDVHRVFAQDLCELHAFELHLTAGRYAITRRGRVALRARLRAAFSDGVAYRVRADAFARIDTPPVRALQSDIQLSSVMGQLTATLSRCIGDQVGIDVSTPDDSHAP